MSVNNARRAEDAGLPVPGCQDEGLDQESMEQVEESPALGGPSSTITGLPIKRSEPLLNKECYCCLPDCFVFYM